MSVKQRFVNRVRSARTRVVHRIRATFGLYRQEARDRLIDGAVRDNAELALTIGKQARVINDLFARLEWYETNIPAIKKARSAYNADRRRARKKAEREAAERAKAAEQEPGG